MSAPGAIRVVEWNLAYFRRMWRTNVLNSFVQPLMYMLGLGVGVGTLVSRNSASSDALGGMSYTRFVAPGMLCTTAMAVAFFESAWPILGGFKWGRQYIAMAATPLRPVDIVLGHLLWVALRVALATTAVMAALMMFPTVRAAGLVPSVAFATLSGVALAMPMAAFSAFQQRDVGFPTVQRFVVIPLFLFGGAFFPVRQLPGWVQAAVKVFPLWHGTELSRAVIRRSLGLGQMTGHLAYLTVWIVVGCLVASWQFRRRLGA